MAYGVNTFFVKNDSKIIYEIKLRFIMKKNNNTDSSLQNRRQFFKNSAKKALPFLALPLLSVVMTACPDEPNGCGKSCSGSCDGDCAGDCDDGCWTACISACVHYQR